MSVPLLVLLLMPAVSLQPTLADHLATADWVGVVSIRGVGYRWCGGQDGKVYRVAVDQFLHGDLPDLDSGWLEVIVPFNGSDPKNFDAIPNIDGRPTDDVRALNVKFVAVVKDGVLLSALPMESLADVVSRLTRLGKREL